MSISTNTRDTTPEAEAVLIQLLRARPATKRLADAVAASNRVAEQCKDAIRQRNPGISEEEVGLRFIEINYGPELANKVRIYLRRNR